MKVDSECLEETVKFTAVRELGTKLLTESLH